MDRQAQLESRLALCVRNDDYPASLEVGKFYQVLPDAKAERMEMIRVIDESGEDYLYPNDYFREMALSRQDEQAVRTALRFAS